MTLFYEDIFSYFLGKQKDYKLISLPEEMANENMCEWLHAAASKPYVRKLFKEFTMSDETTKIDAVLFQSIDDSFDSDFIVDILSLGMLVEWMRPKLNSIENLEQMYGGKEEKFYSQSNHLAQLQSRNREIKNDQRKLIRSFGYDYDVISKRGEQK